MLYTENWKDYADIEVPFLFERVVVADLSAAERGRESWQNSPAPSSPSSSPSEGESGEGERRRKRAPGDNASGAPAWAAPFVGLRAPEGWWAPPRAALLRYLGLPDAPGHAGEARGFWGSKKDARKAVVTYVSMLNEPAGAGARLSAADEERLVDGLRRMEREGVLGEVHVVRGNGTVGVSSGLPWEERRRAEAVEWTERMGAFAKSTVSVTAMCRTVNFA